MTAMLEVAHRSVRTNGIDMHVVVAGDGPLVVCCHGFPELWWSWRHQIPAIAEAGFRVAAPDMRGYGRTDAPSDVASYDAAHLTADLAGLLDALDERDAIFVGHDWGAATVWQMALRHPDRVRAIANLSVPFRGRAPARPTEIIAKRMGDRFFYQLYFQPVGPADEELARDVRRSLRAMLWTWSGDMRPGDFKLVEARGHGMLDQITDPGRLPSWIDDDEFEYYVGEFERTGFTGGLNWYRNIDRNWEDSAGLPTKVEQPTLFIAGEKDGVLLFAPLDGMEDAVPGLREIVLVPGAGHWVQQEAPDAVNAALVPFLREV